MATTDGERPHRGGREALSRPGPAPSLSQRGIASAAVDLADAGGLGAVTMRSVASALGVSAPGLYRYVASREELVGHMVDAVSAGLEHPPPSGDWVHDLTVVAEQQRDLFRAHPWLAEAAASSPVLGPHVLDHLDWGLAVLADVDAPASRKMEAVAMANGIAALFAGPSRPVGPGAFGRLERDRHPRLAELLAGATPTPPAPDLFARVLAGVLRGVVGTQPDAAGTPEGQGR